MLSRGVHILEALVLRSLPGLLNLFALTSIAPWLGASAYGVFSTGLATSGAIASFVFGPLTFSTVACHASLAAEGQARRYEEQIVSAAFLIAGLILVPALALAAAGLIAWVWVPVVVCFGIYTAVQEIHHARLKFLNFGLGAFLQAATFVGLLWWIVKPNPTIGAAVLSFAASYGVGALLSLALSGFPRIRQISWGILRTPVMRGWPITLSTLAADSFVVGFRYLFLTFGALPLLSVFSFCVDVAQRLIGVVINLATFALVPRAVIADAKGDPGAFRRILRDGALFGIVVAILMVVLVLTASKLKLVPALQTDLFDPYAFVLLSAAVVVNRTGKMTLNPMAMRSGRTQVVLYAYLLAGPAALCLGALALFLKLSYAVHASFLVGFLIWAGSCALMLIPGEWSQRWERIRRWVTGP